MDSNKSTPNVHNNSPFIGQAMSTSYGNQWLGSDDSPAIRRSSQGTDEATTASSQNTYAKKSNSTKAERRALQEKQRLEKQKRNTTTASSSKETGSSFKPVQTQIKTGTASDGQKRNKTRTAQQQQPRRSILNHLDLPKKPDTDKYKELHPSILTLALLFSEYKIVGSNARCVAVLETFFRVIADHRPPDNASFARHIQKHLDPHIAFLLNVRYMSLSVRECIRWLKKAVADLVAINPPLADEEARKQLTKQIAHFISERITMADKLIVDLGLSKIEDGDVILTFSKSSIIERLLLQAKLSGKDFYVIVVDSRPLLEGRNLLEILTKVGISCKYTLISSIYVALKTVTKVFMCSHALLNNGCSYSRIGSAAVAMAATDKQIPVIICAETYKFLNRTQVDSLVMNEKGDPNNLVYTNNVKRYGKQVEQNPTLADWKQIPNLNILNLMYDTCKIYLTCYNGNRHDPLHICTSYMA